jgi:aspartyl-tRNA(Asn)/glutamyl-tRNA(Gln) amidotransferase subunit A
MQQSLLNPIVSELLPPPPGALPFSSMVDLVAAHAGGYAKVSETVENFLGLLPKADAAVKSLTKLFYDSARKQAEQLDEQLNGPSSAAPARGLPLLGVPILVKENIAVAGQELRCGSRIMEGYVSPFDSTIVGRLKAAGAVILGSTNMDEFAMGSSCEHSCHGPTHNPYDLSLVPGGSSGGGAASAALGLAPICLGSDTGGSVRQPAAYCNVFGFKPTYGAISRYGLVAFGSSLDQIGPFARSMNDLIQIFRVVAGRDHNDATSIDLAHVLLSGSGFPSQSEESSGGRPTLRVGIPQELIHKVAETPVLNAFNAFQQRIKDLGHKIVEVSLGDLDLALPAYYVISSAEASSNLARFDGLKYGRRVDATRREEAVMAARTQGFGDEVKRRICLGTFALSSGYYEAYYGKAMIARRMLAQQFRDAFETCDVVLTPTAPSLPFALGLNAEDPVKMYANDILTIPPSLVGLPALSVPVGGGGLPIGMQFVAPHGQDARLLRFALSLESERACGIAGIAGIARTGAGGAST